MKDYGDLVGKSFCTDTYNCYHLVQDVFKMYGISLPCFNYDALAYSAINNEIKRQKASTVNWRECTELKVPCVVVIKNHPHFVQHVGAYIGEGLFIHNLPDIGVVIERLNDPVWINRIKGYYEYVDSKHSA